MTKLHHLYWKEAEGDLGEGLEPKTVKNTLILQSREGTPLHARWQIPRGNGTEHTKSFHDRVRI